MIYMPIVMAFVGLAYMMVKKSWVMKQDAGDGKMKEISDHIYEGALAFLKAEYRLLTSICYWSKYSFIYCFNNCPINTLAYCNCFYSRCIFLCISRKYGNENCY